MSDKSRQPYDPNHPAMPDPGAAYPPQSAETGAFGAQAYGQHEGPVPPQQGYPEYGAYGQPHAQQAYQPPGGTPKRPGSVLAGAVLAWIGGAIGLLFGVVSIGSADDLVADLPESAKEGFTDAEMVDALQVLGVVIAVWCLAVIVLATLAFLGRRWAAIGVVAMAAVFSAMMLVGVLSGNGAGLAFVAWTVASAVLIYFTNAAKEWYTAKAAARSAGS